MTKLFIFKFMFLKNIFLRKAISLGRVVVNSLKTIINLLRVYEKLHCKGDPVTAVSEIPGYRQTHSQTSYYIIVKTHNL